MQENQSLKLLIKDTAGNTIYLDAIETPNDTPVLEYAFSYRIKEQPYIVAGVSYSEDYRDVNYPHINWDRYYTTLTYQCDPNYNCTFNKKLSGFFGSGGDLVNYDSNEILNPYLYKNKSAIEDALASHLFHAWLDGAQVNGYTIKDTELGTSSGYEQDTTDYLRKGNGFIVTDVSSGWLKVHCTNGNQERDGWIRCQDTNLC